MCQLCLSKIQNIDYNINLINRFMYEPITLNEGTKYHYINPNSLALLFWDIAYDFRLEIVGKAKPHKFCYAIQIKQFLLKQTYL